MPPLLLVGKEDLSLNKPRETKDRKDADSEEMLYIFLNALTHGLCLQAPIVIKYSLYHFCLRQKYSGDLI